MFPAATYHSRDIFAKIPYWLERQDGSLPMTNEDSMKILRRGEEVDSREMLVHDIRGTESEYTLDRNGFQVWNLEEEPEYTKDDAEIVASQYPVLIEEILRLTQAAHVKILSHIVRHTLDRVPESEKLNPGAYGVNRPRAPATRPHTDFDLAGCPEFFQESVANARACFQASSSSSTKSKDSNSSMESHEHADDRRRWQVLGVWRPLKPVLRHPLALVDAQSMRAEDLVAVPRDYGDKKGANSVLKPGDGGHRWCYLHGQWPDEAWVFKHFDSLEDGGEEGLFARQCAHAALILPGTLGLPMRESVEFRVLVLY